MTRSLAKGSPNRAADMMYVLPCRSSWIWSAPAIRKPGLLRVRARRALRNWSDVRPSPWTTALVWAAPGSVDRAGHPADLAVGLDALARRTRPWR